MTARRLLVIAPDRDVRSALVFTLEASGFDVAARADIPLPDWARQHRFDCSVLDHKALTGQNETAIAFCEAARPVLLLSSRPFPWLAPYVAQTVSQPAADDSLIEAIRAAID